MSDRKPDNRQEVVLLVGVSSFEMAGQEEAIFTFLWAPGFQEIFILRTKEMKVMAILVSI